MTYTKQNRLSARFLAVVTLASLLLSAFSAPFFVAEAATTGDVLITEAMPDPTGADANGEYIVISNESGSSVDLTNWTLDGDTFATSTLAAGDTFKICRDTSASSTASGCDIELTGMELTNTGDTINLLDGTNAPIATAVYGNDDVDEGTAVTFDILNDSTHVYYASLATAIDNASDNDLLELIDDIVTSEQINIDLPITLDGNGHTLDADFVKTSNSNNSAIGVGADDVTIENLTLITSEGAVWPEQLHGINAYKVTGLVLDDITVNGFGGTGIVVNGSEVTASDITTSGNLWHGINVDQGSGVDTEAKLTIKNTSSHDETLHIYLDDVSKDVSVVDEDGQYDYEELDNLSDVSDDVDDPRTAGLYTLKKVEDKVDICKVQGNGDYHLINVSVQAAINGLSEGGVNVGDIIPPIANLLPNGYNWDWGEDWFNNDCNEPTPEPSVTVVATKVICEDEADLPNWQDGGGANITANTAADWVAQHDGCYIDPTWHFQWHEGKELHDGVGDDTFTGPKGNGWSETFTGTTTIDITNINDLSFREVLEPGYIPFTYLTEGGNTDNVTAEFNCSTGGKNYDNLEWAKNVEDGDTIYCAAFNAPVEDQPGQCVATATAYLNDTPSQNNVVDTITEFIIDGDTYESGDSFDLFVLGDDEASDGSAGDDEVRIKRTSDGFELYFYGNGTQDVREFSGSFMLDNVDASGASIAAGSEPLEFGGTWPDQIAIDTNTGEVTFTLYTNTGNDSFIVRGLRKDCDEEPEMCSVTLVSNEDDFVEETDDNAVFTFAHKAWTAIIDGADWIWGSYYVDTSAAPEVQTFIKTFEWSGGISSADLVIAADNYFAVYLNDEFIASSTDEQLFKDENKVIIDLSSDIEPGENELKIEVTNLAGSSDPEKNPAGLKYNLTIVSDKGGDACMYAPDEPSLEITNPDTDGQTLSGEYTFIAEYIDADDDPDHINWAIRAGTCKANQGTVAGNVDGYSDTDNQIGNVLTGTAWEATVDMSTWEDGDYCLVVNPTEDQSPYFRETRWFKLDNPEPEQCTIVSDTNTIVVENNDYAVETWDGHNNWTHDIMDALWIWDSYEVVDTEATTTRTFKETFTVSGLEEAKFYIAADNTYTVYINGTSTYERLNANNYQTPDIYTDVADYLVEGENELVVEVTNLPKDGSNTKTNPAGALFKLKMEVSGFGDCEITTAPAPEDIFYVIDGYKWEDADTDGIWDDNEDPIDGWTIYATDGEQLLSTTTNSTGYYYFEVEEDSWEVYEATSTNWTQTGIEIYVDEDTDGYIDGNSCFFDIDTDESESSFSTLRCDFGNNYEEPVTTTDDDDDSTGGGGGGSGSTGGGGGSDDDDSNNSSPNQTFIQQVAGASTGPSFTPSDDFIEEGAEEQVLGESTTTDDGLDELVKDLEGLPQAGAADLAVAGWDEKLCPYWWLYVVIWLVVTGVAYWLRGLDRLTTRQVFGVNIGFVGLSALGLLCYLIWNIPCVWWPFAVVLIGSSILATFFSNKKEENSVLQ